MSYIITYYLPSGLFVVVSWISFLIPPDIVPGAGAGEGAIQLLRPPPHPGPYTRVANVIFCTQTIFRQTLFTPQK